MEQTLNVLGQTISNIKGIKATNENNSTILYVNTADATATSEDILYGQTAYINGEKVIGSIGRATGVSF